MAPVRAAALAALAAAKLAAAIRLQENVFVEDLKAVAATDPDMDQSMCTTELVEDAVRCGVDEVIDQITDAVRCGVVWCDNALTYYMCPKTCPGEAVSKAKKCEVLVSCPVKITMHIKGTLPTTNIAGMVVKADLIDYKVEQKSADIQQTIDANGETIQPWLQEGMDIGVGVANQMLSAEVSNFESGLITILQDQVVKDYATVAKWALGGQGFGEGLIEAVSKRFSHIAADMYQRSEVNAAKEDTTSERLCHRLLRVRTHNDTILFRNWTNALIARKYDSVTNCNSAYTAHCGTGVLTQVKKCPLQKEETKRQCLFGSLCWSRYRTVENSATKVSTLYVDGREQQETQDFYVDHVADNVRETPLGSSRSSLPGAAYVVQPLAASQQEADADKLDTLVEINDDQLPLVLRDEVCLRVRANSWYAFRAIKEARCRLVLKGLGNMASITQDIKIGSERVTTDLSIKGGNFKAEFIPDWKVMEQLAENAIYAELKGVEMPLGSKLQELNLKFDGDGHNIQVEARPVLTGVISAAELQELKDRLLDGQPLPSS